jgi:hypothetical protein
MYLAIKICVVGLASLLAITKKPISDRSFTGFFSKLMKIDTTSATCGAQTPALLFAFQSDTVRGTENVEFLYGLVKCPSSFNQALFTYNSRIKLSYRECKKEDLEKVMIVNRRKFFNVHYYLVTAIEPAE